MNWFNHLNPFNQLITFVSALGLLFLFLVVYLDNSKNFALKRDWREKK